MSVWKGVRGACFHASCTLNLPLTLPLHQETVRWPSEAVDSRCNNDPFPAATFHVRWSFSTMLTATK